MAEASAEQFAQRVLELGLVEARDVNAVKREAGSRNVSLEEVKSLFLRRELLTNWQIERVLEGKTVGFFYGNYKMLYTIGAGTFARVYRAEHVETKKVVAVKVLRQRFTQDMTRTEHFLREASVVIPMRHKNIVPIYEVKSERGRYYMVMEFVEGQNLRDFVKAHGKLSPERSLGITADICAGLDYAFQQGVTHRDMKLSNVLLSSKGVGKLVDFGLAAYDSSMSDEQIAESINARSIDYAALERATNVRKNDKRSDIYFLGCMLYHMVSGDSPLLETRDRMQRLNADRFYDVKPITDVMPDVPLRIVQILNRSMELKVDQRYQSPGEMWEDIQAALKASSLHADSSGAADRSQQAAKPDEPAEREGESHSVMLVESNMAVQNALRDRLKQLGYRVLVIGNPQRALERFDFDTTVAECIVFGTTELGSAALQAFNQFAENQMTKDIPAIVLVDKRQKDLVRKRAKLAEHRVIVSMPLKFQKFRAVLKSLIAKRSAKST